MAAHSAAIEAKIENGAVKTVPDSMNALIVSYYRSPDFLGLRPITQQTYRNLIERIRREHGEKPVALLGREHVKRIMAMFADRPDAANRWLKMLRVLMRHAVEAGFRKDNRIGTGAEKRHDRHGRQRCQFDRPQTMLRAQRRGEGNPPGGGGDVVAHEIRP